MKKDNLSLGNIMDRMMSETPSFWKKVRNVMLAVGTVSGIIVAAPVALPAVVVTVAGYGLTVGAVGAALSQMTKKDTPTDGI